jgi:hypothetical protein
MDIIVVYIRIIEFDEDVSQNEYDGDAKRYKH